MEEILTYSWFAGVAALFLEGYAIYRAVSRDHGVERTLAWVFAIIAFPVLGAIAYFMLASPSIRRTTRRMRAMRDTVRERRTDELAFPALEPFVHRPGEDRSQSLLRLAQALTGFPPTSGNLVELLAEDHLAFRVIEECLMNAKRSVWAEYYLIRNDETGHRFLDILISLATKGIEVRLLYDAVGSLKIDAYRLRTIANRGGKVEVFLPVNPLRRRWSVHLRNHRKMVIVDGTIGFTGGMNVGDEYSGRARKKGLQHFHDTHLSVRGPAVQQLAEIFAEDWAFASGEPLDFTVTSQAEASGGAIMAILPSGPDQEHNANGMAYFSGIAGARDNIFLSSPYFIPEEPITRALISASLRGVDVRVLVPAVSDVPLVRLAARSYYPKLLRSGVRVFEYLPSMLHAKTLVVDSHWGLVGSANVDIRSFRLNFELGALILDPDFVAKLESRYMNDLRDSREITIDDMNKLPVHKRLRINSARLLSPLL